MFADLMDYWIFVDRKVMNGHIWRLDLDVDTKVQIDKFVKQCFAYTPQCFAALQFSAKGKKGIFFFKKNHLQEDNNINGIIPH